MKTLIISVTYAGQPDKPTDEEVRATMKAAGYEGLFEEYSPGDDENELCFVRDGG